MSILLLLWRILLLLLLVRNLRNLLLLLLCLLLSFSRAADVVSHEVEKVVNASPVEVFKQHYIVDWVLCWIYQVGLGWIRRVGCRWRRELSGLHDVQSPSIHLLTSHPR